MTSPSTPMRFPLRRGSKRFRRGMESEIALGIFSVAKGSLFGSGSGFFGHHHGNVVANGINDPALRAFETTAVREQLHRSLAHRANENFQQFRGDGHSFSQFSEL